jgi:hypothetical protein
MVHPFQRVTPYQRKILFIFLVSTTILLMLALNILGVSLRTNVAPAGIISYELAGSVDRSRSIIESWDSKQRILAGFHLGLDFLFIFIYPSAIAFCLVWISDTIESSQIVLNLLIIVAWLMFLAVLLDFLENCLLLIMLLNGPTPTWTFIARWSAILKFGIVIVGLTSILLGLIVSRIRIDRLA